VLPYGDSLSAKFHQQNIYKKSFPKKSMIKKRGVKFSFIFLLLAVVLFVGLSMNVSATYMLPF
ncbi:MAG TPA: hypothetical protein VKA34_06455, partial [Balneolales bacterium]|nr:hypothetical protein [Balneolales bacterium]